MGWVIALTAIGFSMLLLGRLSKRMGMYTHVRAWHRGFYLAAALLWLGSLFRMLVLIELLAQLPEVVQNSAYVLLGDALPALGITIALLVAWHYWSWLLAERD